MAGNELYCSPDGVNFRDAGPRADPSYWIEKDDCGFHLDTTSIRLVTGIKISFDWYRLNRRFTLVKPSDDFVFVSLRGKGYFIPATAWAVAREVQDRIGYLNAWKCSNCKYFSHHADIKERVQGDCRRKAPLPSNRIAYELMNVAYNFFNRGTAPTEQRLFPLDEFEAEGRWPVVMEDHWCGEHSDATSPIGGLGSLR